MSRSLSLLSFQALRGYSSVTAVGMLWSQTHSGVRAAAAPKELNIKLAVHALRGQGTQVRTARNKYNCEAAKKR